MTAWDDIAPRRSTRELRSVSCPWVLEAWEIDQRGQPDPYAEPLPAWLVDDWSSWRQDDGQ